jgi:hypothetical protein
LASRGCRCETGGACDFAAATIGQCLGSRLATPSRKLNTLRLGHRSRSLLARPATLIDTKLVRSFPGTIATSELDKTRPVRHVMFICDCGRTSNQAVAEI